MSSWYGQKNYTDKQGVPPQKYTIAQVGCFLTSFCNLLKKFGRDVDPASLNRLFVERGIWMDVDDGVRDDLAWSSITAYDGSISVSGLGAGGEWPNTNNAIVKFHFVSKRTGHPTDHFCLVADENAHTIIDSWDGVVKSAYDAGYGVPIAWASYNNTIPQAVAPIVPPTVPSSAIYTVQKGDSLSAIAAKNNTTYQILAEMNGIQDASKIEVGQQLRLPVNTTAPSGASPSIRYEILDTPQKMHINKAGGAELWAFGNVKKWSDFVSTGHAAENTNFDAVGIAHVPIGDETAGYYMDALCFGDYVHTGAVAMTTGFSWADLAPGYYEPPAEPLAPTPTEPPAVAPDPEPDQVPEPDPETVAVVDTPPPADDINTWKSTIKNFYVDGTSETLLAKETMVIHDLDEKLPDKELVAGQRVQVAGTFLKDGVLYARPSRAATEGWWYGVPMTNLSDELFNTNVDLVDKQAMHTLTFRESILVGLAKMESVAIMLINKLKSKK